MAKQSRKRSSRRTPQRKSKILEAITPTDALAILRRLAQQDAELAERIEEAAMETLGEVDVESVASLVQMELELLDVEEVWDASGSTFDGYVDPGDAAWEMFEDALERFREEAEKYKRLSMKREAKLQYMGILEGIYRFHKESTTEYKDWAVDAPGEYFSVFLNDYRKWTKNQKDLVEMNEFLEKNCPDWASPRGNK